MSSWKVIVKYNFKRSTYFLKKHRIFTIVFLYSFMFFWSIYIGPFLFDLIIPEFIRILEIGLKGDLIDYSFIALFLISLMIPIYSLYKKKGMENLELILATPIKPKDFFLSDFISKLPFQILEVFLISPFIAGFLRQLKSLDYIHFFLLNIILFGVIISGTLAGKLIAHPIEKKILQNKSPKRYHKYLLYLISIAIIFLYYLLRFTLHFFLNDPALKKWLIVFPSFWYSNIILYIIDPSLTIINFQFFVLCILFSIIFPIGMFFILYKISNPIFESSIPIKKKKINKKHKKNIYDFFLKLSPPKAKNLITIHFKVFLRNQEGIYKLIYILFLSLFLGIIVSISWNSPWVLTEGFQDKFLIILIVAWMGGFFFGFIISTKIFISSKELLFLYKRSPKGIKSLFKSYLYFMVYIIVGFDIILTLIYTFLFQFTIFESAIYFILYFLYCFTTIILAVGIYCFKPLIEDQKNSTFYISYAIFFIYFISFLLSFCIYVPFIPISIEASIGLTIFTLLQLGLVIGWSILIYIFGLATIQKIE